MACRAQTSGPPDRTREGGVGWPLIIHFSDDVEYRREADANVLRFRIPIVVDEEDRG